MPIFSSISKTAAKPAAKPSSIPPKAPTALPPPPPPAAKKPAAAAKTSVPSVPAKKVTATSMVSGILVSGGSEAAAGVTGAATGAATSVAASAAAIESVSPTSTSSGGGIMSFLPALGGIGGLIAMFFMKKTIGL